MVITNAQKTGRNEQCPCGSNKKFKYCCGSEVGLRPKKKLTPKGFQQCFMKLVEDAGGKIEITCEDLEKLAEGKDKGLGIRYDQEADSFHFEMVKVKLSNIIQPDKRVRVGR